MSAVHVREVAARENLEQREQFLTTLFEDLPGAIEVRSISSQEHPGPRRQTFCDGIPRAMEAIAKDAAAGYNVYVGIATRGVKLNEHGRRSGGKDNLVACRALWVDKDELTEEGAREEWEITLEGLLLE